MSIIKRSIYDIKNNRITPCQFDTLKEFNNRYAE